MTWLPIAFRIALKLIPTIKAVANAAKKNSDGGKKITAAELATILGVTPDPVSIVLEELDVKLDAD